MDVKLQALDECLAKRRVSAQYITTVTIISCFTSLLAFLVAIPLLEVQPLLLNPFACLLTLFHHGIVLYERTNIVIPNPASTNSFIASSSSSSSSRRVPISAALPMILVIWLTGAIWLAVSTINASLLGMSLWVDPNGHHVHIYLITGVILPMMEAILLMFLVSWCFQERQAVFRINKELRNHQSRMGEAKLEVWKPHLSEIEE